MPEPAFDRAAGEPTGWFGLLAVCLPAGYAVRETGLVFLFDLYVYPVALALGGLLRLILNARARRAAR